MASLPATIADAQNDIELLGAAKKTMMNRARFEGVLILAARDDDVLTSMVRTYRRWTNQYENVDDLWVPNEWNEFWSSTEWRQILRRDELTPEEIIYANMALQCQVPQKLFI